MECYATHSRLSREGRKMLFFIEPSFPLGTPLSLCYFLYFLYSFFSFSYLRACTLAISACTCYIVSEFRVIFIFGNHEPLKRPACNPFTHRYFWDWFLKISTFSPWNLPNMTEYNAIQNNMFWGKTWLEVDKECINASSTKQIKESINKLSTLS